MGTHDETLRQVTSRVLEDLCFHWVDPEATSVDDAVERACASVGFSGPWCGRLLIGVERCLLQELTANLLGDEEAAARDSTSALLELANVLCGNALPEIDSPTSAFELGSPVTVDVAALGEPVNEVAHAAIDAGRVVVRIVRC